MPEMIQVNELVTFECLNCGYITKGKRGEKINCPKCQPDFKGYFVGAKNTEQQVQLDSEHKQGTYDNPIDAIVTDAPRELT